MPRPVAPPPIMMMSHSLPGDEILFKKEDLSVSFSTFISGCFDIYTNETKK
jgi:hypothetical protein